MLAGSAGRRGCAGDHGGAQPLPAQQVSLQNRLYIPRQWGPPADLRQREGLRD